jgi:hypothetical protein
MKMNSVTVLTLKNFQQASWSQRNYYYSRD